MRRGGGVAARLTYRWRPILNTTRLAALAAFAMLLQPVAPAPAPAIVAVEQLITITQPPDVTDVPRTYDLPAAIAAAFPVEQQSRAHSVAMCESRGDPAAWVVDTNGLVSAGAWQVQAHWWGDVPNDLLGQAHQAAAIVAEAGWLPWSCATMGH